MLDIAQGVLVTLNGAPVRLDGPAGERLSYALRERCGLTGVKVGCNAGDCGACTVLIDGEPVCACLTTVGQIEGRHVETVEGLPEADPLVARLRAASIPAPPRVGSRRRRGCHRWGRAPRNARE